MHSSATRATDGTSSVRRAFEVPNLRVMSEARNELSASAASSGTVIIESSPYPCSPGFDCPCASQKRWEHAAPLSGCADAVLPLLSHAKKRSPMQTFLALRLREARISAHGAASGL